MTALRIENLSKHYGAVRALDGLTLSVQPGTVFGFLGPNGAGKTTTLRLLTGLAAPSGGQAWVNGHDITSGEQRATIGYLPEDPVFYNWMTPAEFLDHVGRIFGLPPAERKARTAELLRRVDLQSVSKRRIGGFSRGMRQRLGLAQALVNRPPVLLLDEPVSALDPAGRRDVLEMIASLRGECTVFMSTHILADVERICDSVGILNHGKLVLEARQDELLERYTIPAFELEVEPHQAEPFMRWAESLEALPWVAHVLVSGISARVTVHDLRSARQGLLLAAAQSGLDLRRVEIVKPSLEDIFLKVVNGSELPAEKVEQIQ